MGTASFNIAAGRAECQERARQAGCLTCPFCDQLPEVRAGQRGGYELYHGGFATDCILARSSIMLTSSAGLESIAYSWNHRARP